MLFSPWDLWRKHISFTLLAPFFRCPQIFDPWDLLFAVKWSTNVAFFFSNLKPPDVHGRAKRLLVDSSLKYAGLYILYAYPGSQPPLKKLVVPFGWCWILTIKDGEPRCHQPIPNGGWLDFQGIYFFEIKPPTSNMLLQPAQKITAGLGSPDILWLLQGTDS